MKTVKETIDLFYKNIPESERMYSDVLITEIAKSVARQACKEQREICFKRVTEEDWNNYDGILYAPSPNLL